MHFLWFRVTISIMNSQKEFKLQFEEKDFYFHYTSEEPRSFAPYYKHCHSNYELYVFLEGNVDFIVENTSYKMQPNSILLIPPHKYHYAKISNLNKPYRRFTFLFSPSAIPDNLKELLENEPKIFPWNANEEILSKYFNKIPTAINNFSTCDTQLLLSLLLTEILLDLKYCDKSFQPTINYTVSTTLCNILSFVNEHIYEPLTVESISSSLFLTPVYVSQLFSKTMHISLMRYVKQKKLLLANDLIRNGSKATNAAIMLGFSDYSTFFRLYKKEFGHAPSNNIYIKKS